MIFRVFVAFEFIARNSHSEILYIIMLTPYVILEKDNGIPISTTGRYVPPPIEVPSANELGLTLIAIIVIFLVPLIILDITTLRKDTGWLLNNIRLQKRLWQAKKRLHEAKRERAKASQ